MHKKQLLYLGIIIPIVFWMTTIICGYILGDYNHLTRMVSELGEIGTNTQYLFSLGLIVCAILSVLFILGLYQTCKIYDMSIIPILVLLSYSFSIGGAAIFPFPLRMHLIMGMPSILLFLSPLLGFFLWKRENNLIMLKQMSVISFIIMSLGFITYFPNLLGEYLGVKQRFFHIGWSVWFSYLSYSFIKLREKEKLTNK
ncbi:MAG: DUF998 domain-containing protein [Ignavibacteriales bacterium]|nr:DUF998 domain-containing protein [Ignavibacteriales bacterium]